MENNSKLYSTAQNILQQTTEVVAYKIFSKISKSVEKDSVDDQQAFVLAKITRNIRPKEWAFSFIRQTHFLGFTPGG